MPEGDCFMNDQPQESTHPGPYVREHVLPRGLTVTEAARRMGVGRPALSNFLNGKAALSPAMAIRLERTFGADRDALLDLQTRYDAREAPAGRHAITAVTYAPSVLTIRAREIEDWAGRIRSRQELGVLVRRLVNSTSRNLSKVDFPAHDHAERRGWDGVVVASTPTPWIPEGESGWELSCDASPKDKANKDFARRTNSIPLRERKACTFVFVTPRDWPGKTTWANEQRKLGLWKDVRACDASDLEQWIEQSVPVQIWYAERLGRPVAGYRSLAGFWTEWASAAEPDLSSQLFATAVERHSERFQEWLGKPPTRPFTIAADSRDEAIAFLACLMGQEDGADRTGDRGVVSDAADHRHGRDCADADAGDRGIVFDTPDALHRLASAAPAAFVVVAGNREVEKAFSGFCRVMHCIAPRPRNSVDPTGPTVDVVLELPGYVDFEKALEAMGVRRDKADRLALESARSPTILRRRLSVVPAVREPDWGNDLASAGKVIPAAMIGAWHAASRADREIVSLLADADYEDVESGVAEMLRLDDPPVWSIGQYRGVVSRLDALFATAPFVTEADLDRVFLVAEYVLSESDPALELPENERWMAAVHGKLRDHSNALRRGLGETLILLAEYGGQLFDERWGGRHIEGRVSDLVRNLLFPLDIQRLSSFEADLPALAEAAPQAFLEVIEDDLLRDEPTVLELMKPVDTGIFGGGCSRSGILWALECLAWSPELLPRVVEVLARLSCRKIEDNWVAKPWNTLLSLFRYWMPETAASVEQRTRALEGLVARHPEIGWSIALDMARVPRTRQFADPNYRPKWRGDPSGAGRSITHDEGRRFIRKSRDICLNWPMHDERTLSDLVDSLEELGNPAGNKVCGLLDQWVDEPQSDQAKEVLRERIRRCTFTDDFRTGATAKRLHQAMTKLEPANLVARHRWLFASLWPRSSLDDADSTFDQVAERVHVQRLDALRAIWRELGFNGLNGLCRYGDATHVVGCLMPEILHGTQETVPFVRWCLDKMSERGAQRYEPCLESFLSRIDADSLPALAAEVGRSHGESGQIRLFVSMRYRKARELLESEPDTFRMAYWEKVEFGPGNYSAEDIHEMVNGLLEADRPLAALKPVSLNWGAVETSRLTKLLHALADLNERFDGSSIPGAFESLDRRSDATAEEKAKLEFMFFRVLERSRYRMPNLARQIVSSPDLYAEAIVRAFPRRNRGEDPPELRIDNAEQREGVAKGARALLRWIGIDRIPGSHARIVVDAEKLIAWLAEVRALCVRHGRAEAGDLTIGELLSRAPADDDGRWPCKAVCEALERLSSGEVDRGFIIGTYNARGVVTRKTGEGGEQERELVAKYRGWAQQIAYEYPHVSGVLARIADGYERDAGRQDTQASLLRRFPNW